MLCLRGDLLLAVAGSLDPSFFVPEPSPSPPISCAFLFALLFCVSSALTCFFAALSAASLFFAGLAASPAFFFPPRFFT
ncbi:hypothetical protein K523DRAFT_325717 [Schizophyllum commune Tattone D]|nr:hypothetical protein K523DRAFT_325717 [Schizophyllum commune Tattone D]